MAHKLRFHSAIPDDLVNALNYYDGGSIALGNRFRENVDRRLDPRNRPWGIESRQVAHAEMIAAIRFRDGFAPGRLRPVRAIEELLPQLRPQGAEVLGELLQRDAVGPGGSAVGFHVSPSLLHVLDW